MVPSENVPQPVVNMDTVATQTSERENAPLLRTNNSENRDNVNAPSPAQNPDEFLRLQIEQLARRIENQNSHMKANAVSIVTTVAQLLTDFDENRRQVKRAILQTLENIANRTD